MAPRLTLPGWLRQGARAAVLRCLPKTLFGRLALLLFVAVLASHVLALTLMFELHPPPEFGGEVMDEDAFSWFFQKFGKRLASAADELGRDIDRPPLPEDGTTECREASRVFNQMQAQIRQHFRERDRFVAAVSHDLRTPLTRLRLRAESLADPLQRQRFSHDVAEMDQMISATLDYLCGTAAAEPWSPLDITALVTSLADDQQACGHAVQVQGVAAPVVAQMSALRRCLSNLVDNAIRYGGSHGGSYDGDVQIRLIDSPQALHIEVCDSGPGLPEHEFDKVLAPFYRVDASRNRAHGGVGLGLSIAHDIAKRHRGSLQLRHGAGEGEHRGLVVRLSLPR